MINHATYQHICNEDNCTEITNTEKVASRRSGNATISAHTKMYVHMLKQHNIRITIGCYSTCSYVDETSREAS